MPATTSELAEAAAAITTAVSALSTVPTGATLDEYAAAHQALNLARRDLGDVMDRITTLAAAIPHADRTVVDGVGVVEFSRTTGRTTWDDQQVMAALWDAATVDTSTGEVADTPDPARLVQLFTAAARPAWRVTALRKVAPGLDLDEARYTLPGRLTMRVT